MGRRQAGLSGSARVIVVLLAVAALAPVPWAGGPPRQDSGLPRDAVSTTIQDATAAARGELAALSVAHASRMDTIARLRARLTEQAEQARAASLAPLDARAQALDASLSGLAERSTALTAEAEALAGCVDQRSSELLTVVRAEPRPRLQVMLDAQVEMGELAAETAPLGVRSDALLRELARLNAQVEDVGRALLADRPKVVAQTTPAPREQVDLSQVPVVELRTQLGTLTLELWPDVAPRHVENFLRLCREGSYDGLTFHRIIPGFVVQGGCPVGDGSGGPGYTLAAEFNDRPHHRGTLSMARFGHPDSAGSQFFLCLDDWSAELDGKYTVFGRLLAGDDALDAIAALGTETGVPLEPVIIEDVVVRPRGPDDDSHQTPEPEQDSGD